MTVEVGREYPSYYKWVMLALFASMNFVINFCQFQPSYFAQDIMDTYGVTSQGYTLMTAFPMAVGLFLAVVTGRIADRFGLRKTVFIALAVSAVGCVARAYCSSYVLLLLMSMLIGVAATFCSANLAKMAMLWFPPNQVGMVIGIVTASASAGLAVAQGVMGFLFDDFYTAFFWGGIVMAVVWVFWGIFARDKAMPQGSEAPGAELSDGEESADGKAEGSGEGRLKDVVKSRGLWLAGMGLACYNGFSTTICSLIIVALVATWGTVSETAGIMASLFTIGEAIGAVVVPTWIVHVKKAKGVCIALPIGAVSLMLIAWYLNIDAVRLIAFPISGFLLGGIYPICMSYPSILPEIDDRNSGAAGGLLTSISLIGGIVVPSFIVTPIAGTNYNLMMAIVSVVGLLAAIPFSLLPSVYAGEDGGEKDEKGAQR